MAQVLIYTDDFLSQKYSRIYLNCIVYALHHGYSLVIPNQVSRIEILGDDNDFSKTYNKLFKDFIDNTFFETENELKKGDEIILEDGKEAIFERYDVPKMCIVTSDNEFVLKFKKKSDLLRLTISGDDIAKIVKEANKLRSS